MFHEIRIPETWDYRGTWGPWWAVLVDQSPGGYRRTQAQSPVARGQYRLSIKNRTEAETISLLAFFNAIAQGRAHGFRLHDLNPGEDTGTEEPLGVGDGARTQWQLVKRYTLGALTYDRPITKPVAVTAFWLDGVLSTDYTLNTVTGVLTTSAPVPLGVLLTASFTFDVPVRFDTDHCRITAVEPGVYTWDEISLVALLEQAQV